MSMEWGSRKPLDFIRERRQYHWRCSSLVGLSGGNTAIHWRAYTTERRWWISVPTRTMALCARLTRITRRSILRTNATFSSGAELLTVRG